MKQFWEFNEFSCWLSNNFTFSDFDKSILHVYFLFSSFGALKSSGGLSISASSGMLIGFFSSVGWDSVQVDISLIARIFVWLLEKDYGLF